MQIMFANQRFLNFLRAVRRDDLLRALPTWLAAGFPAAAGCFFYFGCVLARSFLLRSGGSRKTGVPVRGPHWEQEHAAHANELPQPAQ